MWNSINSEYELTEFMEMHDALHDSCIKELKYISGAYVNDDLSMYPINDKRILRVVIQRQSKKHSVIEMEFSGLKYLKLFPNNEFYTCEILDATMIMQNGYIIWCDCGGLTEVNIEEYEGTVICASRFRWRALDEYLGPKEVYVSLT